MKKLLAAVAVLAVVALAAPVMAADAPGYALTVGGRVKADMGWQALPEGSNRNGADATITNFFATVNSNSYLRALFTSADKTTGAHIEFGFGSAVNRDNGSGIGTAAAPNSYDVGMDNYANIRFAYGWWKVGSCKLLVGQFAGRLGDRYFPGSNLGHTKSYKTDLSGFGFIGGTRNPKVALQMDINENFGFEVALGQAGSEAGFDADTFGTFGSTNSYLPRLEVVLDFKFGNFMITPGAGISYQQYKFDGAFADPEDDNILSYLLWLPAQYKSGPFTIMANAFYSQNRGTDWTGEWGGPAGISKYQFGGQPAELPVIAGGKVEDTTSWGVGAAVQYAFTEQLSVNVGGGLEVTKNDAWEALNVDNRNDYTRWGAFIAVPYKVTSNFTVAPELAYYSYGDDVTYNGQGDESAKDEWLLGVHFQFLF